MVDEAPRFFPERNKPYILELAREYATEVARHNLERAAEQNKDLSVDAYESITSLEIELI